MKKFLNIKISAERSSGEEILVNTIRSVTGEGVRFLGEQINQILKVQRRMNNLLKLTNEVIEKPEIKTSIDYIINHNKLKGYDPEEVKDKTIKYAKLFPGVTAANPDLIVSILKHHFETGVVPVELIKILMILK
jgi:hypothetical protein